ncbi:AAA family ATPase [Micromonospora okii]|uniref:AAA family ATPase n=1 Tax=Micromonospora okii TaxID=1182970 RepID=UPI001E3F1624|nr:AAA family ATPase [Micromonospora okii]
MRLEVENFRSLRQVSVPLGPLAVMVGPNGAGKTNLLDVFGFLADTVHTDLEPALSERGGFDQVLFCGGEERPSGVRINLTATWTPFSNPETPDEYELRVWRLSNELYRREFFRYALPGGGRQEITVSGEELIVETIDEDGIKPTKQKIGISRFSGALSTLPRLSHQWGGEEVTTIAENLSSFRAFEVHVDAARRPSRFPQRGRETLRDDSSNLAAFLFTLSEQDPDAWRQLVEDAMAVLPQLDDIEFDRPSGAAREVVVMLRERGLRRATQLADASYGTIRLLGLLALLYDSDPPALTCIEEIDHGLHPQALELLVTRLREASERTQLLVATHSPALADRLAPPELIVCERGDDGSSVIPAVSTEDIERIVEASEGEPLGRLWFSGALGGDL